MIKKMLVGISGLILIGSALFVVRPGSPKVAADASSGLSPFTAFPLNNGRNTGILASGEGRWYELAPGAEGDFQRQAELTLFFTPDNGSRGQYVNFQIFSADQVKRWYWEDRNQMQNLGAGGQVSRDGDPLTGELLWSGWITNAETYYLQVFNGADVPIDYWLFTGDIVAAELGPTNDPPPAPEVSVAIQHDQAQVASPVSDVPAAPEVEPLLPLASELPGSHQPSGVEGGHPPAGTPTRLIIPAIALDSQVVPVDQTPLVIDGATYGQWNTADDLVGWHDLSARLGQGGNVVLNGHSNVNAAVFRYLEYIKIGDLLTVFSGDQGYYYLVTERFLVKEKDVPLQERIQNASWIAATQDQRLTLVTCANSDATHRLIVIARPWLGGH